VQYIFVAVGCSGCGKSTFGDLLKEKLHDKLEIVCYDDIRKEALGNINDQSNFSKVKYIADNMTADALADGKSVYMSSTNLTPKFLTEYSKYGVEIVPIAFMDSLNPELCTSRVKKQIDSGIERSNTLTSKNGKNIIEIQSERFMSVYKQILSIPNAMQVSENNFSAISEKCKNMVIGDNY